MWMGELAQSSNSRKVCIKAIKFPTKHGSEKYEKVCLIPCVPAQPVPTINRPQAWREEVSIWMRLEHPNVVCCLGATVNPPQIVVDWMPEGEVMEHVQKDPKADRLHFVRLSASATE